MLIPSSGMYWDAFLSSLSRRVNANSQRNWQCDIDTYKLIKKGEC